MTTHEYAIGIDIGGTTTSFGFVDRSGKVAVEATISTHAHELARKLVERICATIDGLRCSCEGDIRLTGIGVGAPNANYRSGTVDHPVNLSWGASTNLVELFRGYYDLPVAITNDANAAAIGEMLFGGARGMKDFIVITLGTGLGSGLVANGELLYGSNGLAGELGHTVVDPQGRDCACGKQGCLEAYVSAGGICRTVSELLALRRDESPLRCIAPAELTSCDVYQAACMGDSLALAAFDRTARLLGMKLADAAAHTGPEAIFVTGGLAEAGDVLLEPTRRYVEEFLFAPLRGSVKLLKSGMPESNGAIAGAAALIWHELGKSVVVG
ncbi:MAG TPA: ROK family protein [Desulfuromonadales bacterium]|nr:ROK family protein [Desulfuromonadales bacterium]